MSLGSDVEVPWRRVLHKSWSEGYRTGTTFHFILECGHVNSRPASKGEPAKMKCIECWAMAACDKHGHVAPRDTHRTHRPCGRCSKAREKYGTAAEQIAQYEPTGASCPNRRAPS